MAGFVSFFQKLGFTGSGEDEVNTGVEYENDADEEEEEDAEEEEEGRSAFGFPFSFSFFGRGRNQDDEEDDEEEDEDEDASQEEEESLRRGQSRQQGRSGRVIDYKKSKEKKADSAAQPREQHCEHIVVVRQLGDSRTIITHLHNGDSVILNLENIDPKDCGRVIDLLSGAAFALGGNIIKVSRLTYLLAPGSVKVVPPQSAPAANRFTL